MNECVNRWTKSETVRTYTNKVHPRSRSIDTNKWWPKIKDTLEERERENRLWTYPIDLQEQEEDEDNVWPAKDKSSNEWLAKKNFEIDLHTSGRLGSIQRLWSMYRNGWSGASSKRLSCVCAWLCVWMSAYFSWPDNEQSSTYGGMWVGWLVG